MLTLTACEEERGVWGRSCLQLLRSKKPSRAGLESTNEAA
jgi:hypothetical protein